MSDSKQPPVEPTPPKTVKDMVRQVPGSATVDMGTGGDNPGASLDSVTKAVNEKVLELLSNSEDSRLKNQKPLFTVVKWAVIIQLIFFNLVIAWLLWRWSSERLSIELARIIFDFLKYYIGAVVVELIGMMTLIVKNTFTSNASKLIEKLHT